MLTFAQFIKEAWTPTVKGWMSPSGKPHLFRTDKEHAENWHPSYRGKKGIHAAQKAGYVRFGSYETPNGTHHFVHYHDSHPKAKQTALRALNHLKPHHSDEVTLSGSRDFGPDAYQKGKAHEFEGTTSHARASLREEHAIDEAQDASTHGYSFHVFQNKPKGHHTIVATHPAAQEDDSFDADMWADTKGISKKLKHPAVGLAVINHKKHDAYTLYVHPKHQRKGIATGLYNTYEKHTGNKIMPSDTLSTDAKSFWKSRNRK